MFKLLLVFNRHHHLVSSVKFAFLMLPVPKALFLKMFSPHINMTRDIERNTRIMRENSLLVYSSKAEEAKQELIYSHVERI
ncbi:hypothetical protein QVD17_37711 [Tagetes erecta]|uniref:Uncharacterized protein n=1 Tax=Tagetes erecta TaxID=13708 RepID=A0AAD8NK26_TARER|nr:hypothetical protein QVD17_37711 [Tagetes erecta]